MAASSILKGAKENNFINLVSFDDKSYKLCSSLILNLFVVGKTALLTFNDIRNE